MAAQINAQRLASPASSTSETVFATCQLLGTIARGSTAAEGKRTDLGERPPVYTCASRARLASLRRS